MATCGEYELERAIGWGRRSTFFAARAIDDRGPALIVIRRARSAERIHRHSFLRAAAEQQAAVGAGCRRLAPILAFDCDETGFAFYATTRFETSLAEFLEAECKTDSVLLREIVTSVLGALAELQEKSRRAHGNLTPGNILLDPHGHFFLTDLAPSAKDATAADDLFSLGTLIYQLVRRTTRIGTLNPPLDYSPAWTESLGDDAEGWLAFTNRLLDKPSNAKPDAIRTALGDLKSLAGLAAKAAKAAAASPLDSGTTAVRPAIVRPPPKKRSPVPFILAAVLLLGGGGGGYALYKKKQAEKERQRVREEELQRQKDVQKLLPGAINKLADEVKQVSEERIPDSTARSLLVRMGKNLGNSTTVDGVISDMNSLIRNWDIPDKMKVQAAAWRTAPREWTRLADALQSAAEVDAKGDTSVVTQFENAIAARNAAADLDIGWEDITRILSDHKAAGNRLLPDFTPWAQNEIRSARDLKDAGIRGQSALKILREVLVFQRDLGPRVLWPVFEGQVPELLQEPSSELLPTWPTRWMTEAKRRVAPEKATLDLWETKLADVKKRIDRLNAKDPKLPSWKKMLEDSRTAIAGAMETDVEKIGKDLEKFKDLELPTEIAHKQYQAFLEKWKAKVEAIAADDPNGKLKAQTALNEFKQETDRILKSFPEYRASLANVPQMASEMATNLATPDKINPIFTRPDSSPEGGDGWKPAPAKYNDPNAALYLFMKNGKVEAQMPFLKIGSDHAMAAWETPLVLAQLSGVKAATLPRDRTTGKQTNGPQTRKDDFSPADDWLWKSPTDLQTKAERTGKGPGNYYAPGVSGGANNTYTPVTWLTFDEADKMAKALGGELPTAEQWKAAYGKNMAGPERRLRSDGAWSKQYPLLKDWAAQTGDAPLVSLCTPDAGSFSRQLKEYDGLKGSAGGAANDTNLWLTQVATSDWAPEKGFTHLIGNAAEWVSDNGKPAVIGASVVSPKLPPDTAFPMSNSAAYFDVTFRLVVKLGEGGAGVGLQKFKEYAAKIKLPDPPVR